MKRKTFDNYDYEEAFPVELDRDIQKKARKNFEKEHPLQVPDYEEQWKEQAQGGQTYRLRQKGSGSNKGSEKGIATGRNRSRGPAPHYRQAIHNNSQGVLYNRLPENIRRTSGGL